jgi:hypothetical protein
MKADHSYPDQGLEELQNAVLSREAWVAKY